MSNLSVQPVSRLTAPVLVLNVHFLSSGHAWRSGKEDGRNPHRLETHLKQARQAAEAGIDILFQAYFSGVNRERVRRGPWNPPFEPFQLAAVTTAAVPGITVMPTVSTLHTHPFTTARALASLDRLSQGRVAFNLVTSFRSGSAVGVRRTIAREQRHAQTREYIDLLRALWQSWPPEANVPDLESGRFIRDDLIADVEHAGEFYQQHGPLDLPPLSRQFPQLMVPAGSLAGLRLAAQTADYVFGAAPTLSAAKRLRAALRSETAAAGRDPSSVRLVLGNYIYVDGANGPQRPDAVRDEDLLALQQALVKDIPSLGIDKLALSDPLPVLFPDSPEETLRSCGTRASGLWELARRPDQSVREFLAAAALQGEHPSFTGSAEQIAAELTRWIHEGGADGFQFILGNDFDALCETIVPALRRLTIK